MSQELSLPQYKTYMSNAISEISYLVKELEKNNSLITDDNTILNYNYYPFMSNTLKIRTDLKEKISIKYPEGVKDTESLLLSICSIYDNKKKIRNHLISLELFEGEVTDFYVNVELLENEFNFSKLAIQKIMKANIINDAISLISDNLLMRMNSNSKKQYTNSNYSNLDINGKIEMLREMINIIYYIQFECDSGYYLFSIDNINLRNSEQFFTKKHHFNTTSYLNYAYYNKKYKNFHSHNKNVIDNNIMISFIDKNLISQSQRIALETMKRNVNICIGAGGSGKTFLSMIIAKRSLELSALLKQHNKKIPFMYTTYSKYSLKQFLTYSSEFSDLIFRKDVNVIKERIQNFSDTVDKSRYEKIKEKLESIDISNLLPQLEKEQNDFDMFSKYMEYTISEENKSYIDEFLTLLENNKKEFSFFDKMLVMLGIKEKEKIYIDKKLHKNLMNTGNVFPSVIITEKIDDIVKRVTNNYLKKSEIATNQFIESDIGNYSTFRFSGLEENDLEFADIVYYMKYNPLIELKYSKDEYIELLQNLLNLIEQNKTLDFYEEIVLPTGKTTKRIDNKKIEMFNDLFPITGDNITNVTDIDFLHNQVIVDEAVLVPGMFIPVILKKSNNIIIMGDINQLSLQMNLKRNIKDKLKIIHETDPYEQILSVSKSYEQKSFFDHISEIIDQEQSLKILVDNFRTRKQIFELSEDIYNEYDSYKLKYRKLNGITNTNYINHYNDDDHIFKYGATQIVSPFVFIQNDENRYQKLISLLGENNIDFSNVMIIVPYQEYIDKVKKLLRGNEILVETIDNIQGIEKKVVIYDSFISTKTDEPYRYLDKKKFNLILTRTKDLFIFMGDENFFFENEIENDGSAASFLISKFFRNNKYDIVKISNKQEKK